MQTDRTSIPFGTLVEYVPVTAKDKSRVHQFGKKTVKRKVLRYVPRAGEGWSEDLMIADHEDVQESEASEVYVKRFTSRDVFVKGEYEFPCATGTLRLSSRPRPSSTAEGKSAYNTDSPSHTDSFVQLDPALHLPDLTGFWPQSQSS